MKTFKNLGIHTLAFGAGTPDVKALRHMVRRAVALGASSFELMYEPMPVLPAKEVAQVLREEKCPKASLCVFHPDGELKGGTGVGGHSGFSRMFGAINYVADIRDEEVEIDLIGGPWAIELGKTYIQSLRDEDLSFLIWFAKKVAERAAERNVRLALEFLQHSEDGLVRNAITAAEIVTVVGAPNLGVHLDTFHVMKNRDNLKEAIEILGSKIFLIHANGIGKDRDTEGRIPCGCTDLVLGGKGRRDITPWPKVKEWLNESGVSKEVTICLEPFSETACAAIPPLRNGVIPITSETELALSILNLDTAGLLVAA